MSDGPLAGTVVAIVGTGNNLDREIAVACAEAGADIALGAASSAQEHVYGMNSIANEIWAIGREHFVLVLAGSEDAPELVAAARTRLGRCDALVAATAAVVDVPVVVGAASGESTVAAVVHALGVHGTVRGAAPDACLPARESGNA